MANIFEPISHLQLMNEMFLAINVDLILAQHFYVATSKSLFKFNSFELFILHQIPRNRYVEIWRNLRNASTLE